MSVSPGPPDGAVAPPPPQDPFGRFLRYLVPLFGLAMMGYEASPLGTGSPTLTSAGLALVIGGPLGEILRKGGGGGPV
jgi:hypothetical protein